MKSSITFTLLCITALILTNCSDDNEIIVSEDQQEDTTNASDNHTDIFAGLPKSIEEYWDGSLINRETYYYTSEGNLHSVKYLFGYYETEDKYYYDGNGNLIKFEQVEGSEYTFNWENGRITEADVSSRGSNGKSKIYYTYNSQGLLTASILYLFNQNEPAEKTVYTYFEDGNLRSMEQYISIEGSAYFELFCAITFDGYTQDPNLFFEFTIIPGKSVQHHFPTATKIKYPNDPDLDRYESYKYQYDSEGRVAARIAGNTKVVYVYR